MIVELLNQERTIRMNVKDFFGSDVVSASHNLLPNVSFTLPGSYEAGPVHEFAQLLVTHDERGAYIANYDREMLEALLHNDGHFSFRDKDFVRVFTPEESYIFKKLVRFVLEAIKK
jgi:hypothetical protein